MKTLYYGHVVLMACLGSTDLYWEVNKCTNVSLDPQPIDESSLNTQINRAEPPLPNQSKSPRCEAYVIASCELPASSFARMRWRCVLTV